MSFPVFVSEEIYQGSNYKFEAIFYTSTGTPVNMQERDIKFTISDKNYEEIFTADSTVSSSDYFIFKSTSGALVVEIFSTADFEIEEWENHGQTNWKTASLRYEIDSVLPSEQTETLISGNMTLYANLA